MGTASYFASQHRVSTNLAAIAERLHASTVQVDSGSGVIWHSDGLIITNAHVVRRSRPTVKLSDGQVFQAEVTAKDSQRDLAALRVKATDLPAISMGNSDILRPGELVLAVGNPLGFVGSVTTGIIHTIDRDTFLWRRRDISRLYTVNPKSKIQNLKSNRWVIADIRLAPGNSGGPLANSKGQVIGINTMIAGGLALAIPSNDIESFLKGSQRSQLGLTLRPVLVQWERRRILGWLVLDVASGSSAMAAGLLREDILIGICGQYFHSLEDLVNVLGQAKSGELLPIEFLRHGKRNCRTVVMGGDKDKIGVNLR